MKTTKTTEDITTVQFVEQVTDIDAPASGFWRLFFKSTGAWIRKNGASAIRLLTESDLVALTFPASARIIGLFGGSQGTRTLFKTSVTDGGTTVGAIPNGASTSSAFATYDTSDPANSSHGIFGTSSAYSAYIDATKTGTGTQRGFAVLVAGVLKLFLNPTTGFWGFGTNSPTAMVDINSNVFRLRTAKTPSSSTDAGSQGEWCWDANYLYICTATNTWKRIALTTW